MKPYLIVLLALPLSNAAQAQTGDAPFPQHFEARDLDSGTHDGIGAGTHLAYSTVIGAPNAPWMQLHFADYDLVAGSYVILTSLQDGDQQRLDSRSLPAWQDSSALLNGDRIRVDLYVAPTDAGVKFKIPQLTVGDWVGGQPGGACNWSCGICDNDDRVPSSDPRVGRLTSGCTAWIVSNRAQITAGHCVSPTFTLGILQFNVPLSACDGTPLNPPVVFQYPVIQSSIVWANTGGADDWAVFACEPNSSTGLL